MVWLMATAVAALAGTVALTTGRVVSGVTPVVKLQLKSAASPLPARDGGRLGRDGDTHGGWGRVGGRTGGKAPAKVSGQRIASQVLGPVFNPGSICGIGREIACWCKGRRYAGVADSACYLFALIVIFFRVTPLL